LESQHFSGVGDISVTPPVVGDNVEDIETKLIRGRNTELYHLRDILMAAPVGEMAWCLRAILFWNNANP
jgi:hypothetical protein